MHALTAQSHEKGKRKEKRGFCLLVWNAGSEILIVSRGRGQGAVAGREELTAGPVGSEPCWGLLVWSSFFFLMPWYPLLFIAAAEKKSWLRSEDPWGEGLIITHTLSFLQYNPTLCPGRMSVPKLGDESVCCAFDPLLSHLQFTNCCLTWQFLPLTPRLWTNSLPAWTKSAIDWQ